MYGVGFLANPFSPIPCRPSQQRHSFVIARLANHKAWVSRTAHADGFGY